MDSSEYDGMLAFSRHSIPLSFHLDCHSLLRTARARSGQHVIEILEGQPASEVSVTGLE